MAIKSMNLSNLYRLITAWSIHAFTATGAFLGVLTLLKIYQNEYKQALWLMAITVIIDSVDGAFARLAKIKVILPNIDGTLLDNIVDYLNYVITPSFFLLVKPEMLPPQYAIWIVLAITLTSTYQFCQNDAKTPDHFFKGFPCYWNFALLYFLIFQTSMYTNAWILATLCVLIFVPVKYVYPSRLDYLIRSKHLKVAMHGYSIVYAVSLLLILWHYPVINSLWLNISLGYVFLYLGMSLYKTSSPLIKEKIYSIKK